MTDFTTEQITALRSPLSREHIKEREQAGRKLSYIEGWVVINEANRIFGFDGWDRETVECRCVCEREAKIGKPPNQRDGWRVAYVAKVRVTVRPNTEVEDAVVVRREGTGFGSGIDVDLGAAHESAIKEAETDAMKRALMTFGNPFGLALYDKAQAEVEPIAARPPPPRPLNKAALPPSPEETPEVTAARQRIRGLIDKIDAMIRTAPNDHVLTVGMDDALDEFKEIEAAGAKGKEAADRLREKYNNAMARFREQAA